MALSIVKIKLLTQWEVKTPWQLRVFRADKA